MMSRRVLILGLVALAGCRSAPVSVESYRMPNPTPPEGIVIVADGAGGYQIAPRAVANAVVASKMPLFVRSFDWSHGTGRGLADVTDTAHARAEGCRLAAHVEWYRTNYPELPVYLVGHSAGCMVVLESTRHLPANRVERIVLLAPAVSSGYDLRPALASSRSGIDVFTSAKDNFYLGLGTDLLGTADGVRGQPAAGRFGFDAPACGTDRLRQHPWDPSVAWSGNEGAHSDSLMRGYLRAYVLPLLRPNG